MESVVEVLAWVDVIPIILAGREVTTPKAARGPIRVEAPPKGAFPEGRAPM